MSKAHTLYVASFVERGTEIRTSQFHLSSISYLMISVFVIKSYNSKKKRGRETDRKRKEVIPASNRSFVSLYSTRTINVVVVVEKSKVSLLWKEAFQFSKTKSKIVLRVITAMRFLPFASHFHSVSVTLIHLCG